jgi:ketosteroid isomerase-like protein
MLRRVTRAEVIGRYLDAMRRGGPDAGVAFYAEDIVAHVPGRGAGAGRHERRDAVAYLRGALERAPHGVGIELIDTLVGERHVALMLRERLKAPDGDVEIHRTNVYRVRDGRIDQIRIFEADQYAVEAFFAG